MFYLDLFRALETARVRYVLVGGVALNVHGVERATMDVDIAIALDARNLAQTVAALRSLNLQPIAPVSWDDIMRPGRLERRYEEKHMLALVLRKADGFAPSVDVLTRTSVPFDTLYANRVVKILDGMPVSIAGIDDLIALKTGTGRKIDASDVEALNTLKKIQSGRK
jgi:predicted nucleotidyltransferase